MGLPNDTTPAATAKQQQQTKKKKKRIGRRGKRTRKKRGHRPVHGLVGKICSPSRAPPCARKNAASRTTKSRKPLSGRRPRAHAQHAHPASAIAASPGAARRMAPFPTPGFRYVPAPPGVKKSLGCALRQPGRLPAAAAGPSGWLSVSRVAVLPPHQRRPSNGNDGTAGSRSLAASAPAPAPHPAAAGQY